MKTLISIVIFAILLCIAAIFFMDVAVLEFVQARGLEQNAIVKTLRRLGEGRDVVLGLMGLFVIYAFCQLFYADRLERIKQAAVKIGFIAGAIVVSGFFVKALKFIFGRPRPDLYVSEGLYSFQWFEMDRLLNSLPSGHASSEAALLVAIGLLWPRYWAILVLVGIIWVPSSIFIQAHWFSDVLFGASLAALVTVCLHRYLLRFAPIAKYLRNS